MTMTLMTTSKTANKMRTVTFTRFSMLPHAYQQPSITYAVQTHETNE